MRENPMAAPPPPSVEADRLASLGGPRKEMRTFERNAGSWADRPMYWIVLLAMPMVVLLGGTSWRVLLSVRQSVRTWRDSLDRRARTALREAHLAGKQGRSADAAAATERAVHAMIESATGVKSRGVLREDLRGRLGKAGASQAAADSAVQLLQECESIRFDPSAHEQRMDTLLRQARDLGKLLGKTRKAKA